MNIINDVLVNKLFPDKPKRTKEIPLLEEKSVSGESIIIRDAYPDMPFKGLHVYGKSTQVTTTGAQLLNTKELITGYYDNVGNIIKLLQRLSAPKIQIPTGAEKISISGLSENISILYVIQNAENVVLDRKAGFKKQHTISLSAEAKTIGISFYIDDTTIVTADMLDTCMINFGDIKPYEPYTGGKPSPSIEYPQEIVSAGDKGEIGVNVYGGNLFNVNAEPSNNANGYQNYIKNNGIYIKNIKRCSALRFKFTVQKYTDITLSAKILSKDSAVQLSNFGLGGSEINGIISFGGKHNITVNTAEHDEIVISFYSIEDIAEYKVEDVIVNVGSNSLMFEPYKEPQTLTLKTPNGLPGVPVDKNGNYIDTNGQLWAVDEKDLARGKYVQRTKRGLINKVTSFNGVPKNGLVEFLVRTENSYKGDAIGILCNKLMGTHESKERIVQGYGLFYIRLSTSRFKNGDNVTIEEANEFFKENPLDVIYILETPIERDLTPEEIAAYKALHTNYPTTVIMNDENAGMKVTYLTPSFIPTRESALRMWFKENPII